MNIQPEFLGTLPVEAIAPRVNAALAEGRRVVVTAPPGSGKSTLLPINVASALPSGKLLMLEPRRAAARQIALRMAAMLGEPVGSSVGYRMRFESKVSDATRIEVVTEGVMERLLVDNPTLDGIAAVIFDEFHERSLTADLCLALTLEAQNLLRPDLKIVLMSATMDAAGLCAALGAVHIEAEGRMFDVELRHTDDFDPSDCADVVARTVRRALGERHGNILAFLPGQAEINRCAEALEGIGAEVFPLHGMLPAALQYRAIEYNPANGRKVVLATPVAETSLTIEGITTVIDSGLCRAVRFDPATGLGRLETERISLDMADQRAGRAGRLAPGVCYRLWSRAAEHRMRPQRAPEIIDSDLTALMLDIAAWGGAEPELLSWLTPPPPGHLADARRLLTLLGALDDDGRITDHGRRMAALPAHPRIANMLLRANGPGDRALAADIAAILEEKDPLGSPEDDADINTRIAELRTHRKSARWARIARIAAQYRRLVRCPEDDSPVSPETTGALIAAAYPERTAIRLKDNVYRLPSGENVRLSDADPLSLSDFLAVASMGRRIFLASPVGRETLEAMARPMRNVSWNSREGRAIARNELRIGVLVIGSRPIAAPDRAEITQAIARAAAKEGRSMFDFSDAVTALRQRIAVVAGWHPELTLPDLSVDAILASAPQWLPLYGPDAVTIADLRRIDLCEVIAGIVGYELMATVNRLAPTDFRLPCGRKARIDYRPGTPDPVLSARLQDCLGLLDTPRVDDGRRPLLVELLSPGFKPVQLTKDLRGFWTGTYFDVRKELRRRYPKHRWPDDPLNTALSFKTK